MQESLYPSAPWYQVRSDNEVIKKREMQNRNAGSMRKRPGQETTVPEDVQVERRSSEAYTDSFRDVARRSEVRIGVPWMRIPKLVWRGQ